jgi:DNA recombination protein RmuC
MQQDAGIFDFAWNRRIVIVTPATLLATLKTVASIWKYEKQNANAREIAAMGGLLYDQFVDFVNEMDKIRKGIDAASLAYDEAMKRLQLNGNSMIRRAEKLRVMGVKNKKLLRRDFLEQPEDIINIE